MTTAHDIRTTAAPVADPAPLVSVVIPAHDARTTLERALRSVERQTYRPLEVIVVDDASVDGTSDVACAVTGLDLRVVRLDAQHGAAGARNEGIRLARGEFIAFLDADDEWLPDKTALQVAALKQDPGVSFVGCDAVWVRSGNVELGLVHAGIERATGPNAWKTLLKQPCVATPAVIARKQALLAAGGFNPALPVAEDQDCWIRLALAGPVAHVSKPLVRVHYQAGSLMTLHTAKMGNTALPMVAGHLERLKGRLAARERDEILANRYASVAREAYQNGRALAGLRYFALALRRGHPVLPTLAYALTASPAARAIKQILAPRISQPSGFFPVALDTRRPILAVAIDTGADPNRPFTGEALAAMRDTLALCRRFALKPACLVGPAFLDNAQAVAALKQALDAGEVEIGATFQPADQSLRNLPFKLEYEGLAKLTQRIEAALGVRPRIYKAGAQGFGRSTLKVLESLDYEIDTSVEPFAPQRARDEPDFTGFAGGPQLIGRDLDILELPETKIFTGPLAAIGPRLAPLLGRAHLGLLRRQGLVVAKDGRRAREPILSLHLALSELLHPPTELERFLASALAPGRALPKALSEIRRTAVESFTRARREASGSPA